MKLTVGNKGQHSDVSLVDEHDNIIGRIYCRGDAEEIARASEKEILTTMFMEKLEAWEAKLIMTDECWKNGLPKLTQELYDEWIALQQERNKLLNR